MEEETKNNDFLRTCAAYLVIMAAFCAVRVVLGLGWLNSVAAESLEIGFTVITQIGIMFLLPFFIFKIAKRNVPIGLVEPVYKPTGVFTEFNYNKISGKFFLLAFLLGILLYILNIFVANFFANILNALGYRFPSSGNTFHGISGLFTSLFLIAVLPGFCEEFTHRGMLLTNFVKKFGTYKGVLFVSLLFGLMHMNAAQFFYAAVLGWFICMAVMVSKSVWVGVIIHFANNAIGTYMGYTQELNLPGAEIFDLLYSNIFVLMLAFILIIIAVGHIMRYMARVNFEKQKEVYTARYISMHAGNFAEGDFEKVSAALEQAIKRMPLWTGVFAYIETHEKPQRLTAGEKTLFVSLFVLGGIITAFSMYWGLL